jgi:hypothetical protein
MAFFPLVNWQAGEPCRLIFLKRHNADAFGVTQKKHRQIKIGYLLMDDSRVWQIVNTQQTP